TVESELGAGSIFTLWLPERIPEQAGKATPASRVSQAPESPGDKPSAPAASVGNADPQPVKQAVPPAVRRPAQRPHDADNRLLLVVEDDPAFARILSDLAREHSFEALIASDA